MFTTVSVQLPHPVLLQLIAHLEKHGGPQDLSATLPPAPASGPSQPPKPRQVEAGPEWSLPERRKYRFRMEDIAY